MTGYPTGQQGYPGQHSGFGAAHARPGNDLFDGRFPLLGRITKNHVDMTVWFVWLASTTLPLPMVTMIRYACAAYFAAGLVLHPRQLLPVTARSWPVFLLPLLMFVSALWAPSSSDAIRKSFLFVLTGLIPIFLATRLSARQIIFGYLLIEMVGAALSYRFLNYGWGGVATGIYGQKNWLAVHMFLLYAAGITFALDRQLKLPLRLLGVLAMGMGIGLIYLSKSTTTLLVAIMATTALFGHAWVWEPARRVRHMRTLLVLMLVVLFAGAALLLFGLMNVNAMDSLLKAFGKDSTLTGRTYLWEHARDLMREHPWGLGAEGFWRPEIGDANSITRKFHFSGWTRFSFHNAYLEIGVELGYLGMYAMILIVGWGLFNCARNWLLNQNQLNAFFLVMAIVVLIRTNAEIDLASQLNPIGILFFIGAIRRDKRPAPVFAPEPPPPEQQPSATPPPIHRGRVIRR